MQRKHTKYGPKFAKTDLFSGLAFILKTQRLTFFSQLSFPKLFNHFVNILAGGLFKNMGKVVVHRAGNNVQFLSNLLFAFSLKDFLKDVLFLFGKTVEHCLVGKKRRNKILLNKGFSCKNTFNCRNQNGLWSRFFYKTVGAGFQYQRKNSRLCVH